MEFSGCYTALVTPFNEDLSVDYLSLSKILEEQVESGVSGVVVMGTTGESPTLNHKEHNQLIEFVVKEIAGRCLVIAGTGSNDTQEAIDLTKNASKNGADASLQVCPYYNKPSQEGLYKHYAAIANLTSLPIILYNVPSRSGVGIELETVCRLAELNNIRAIKEASGSVERVVKIKLNTDLDILSGDDGLILPMMSVGAKGLISVLSNAFPKQMSQIIELFLKNDIQTSKKIFYQFYNLMNAMFIESNPIPIKTVLALQGKIKELFRLPLSLISTENKKILSALLEQLKN